MMGQGSGGSDQSQLGYGPRCVEPVGVRDNHLAAAADQSQTHGCFTDLDCCQLGMSGISPELCGGERAASGLGDRAANCERVAHGGVEVGVLGVRLDTKRVKGLAEEAPRGRRENNIGDLLVR